MSGYVLDDLVLIAGLAGAGSEHQRRELSRLLHGAIDGGPALDLPALCLTAATAVRPGVADHVAEIVAAAPAGAIGGFPRSVRPAHSSCVGGRASTIYAVNRSSRSKMPPAERDGVPSRPAGGG